MQTRGNNKSKIIKGINADITFEKEIRNPEIKTSK